MKKWIKEIKINKIIVFATGCSTIDGMLRHFPGATAGLVIGILLAILVKK